MWSRAFGPAALATFVAFVHVGAGCSSEARGGFDEGAPTGATDEDPSGNFGDDAPAKAEVQGHLRGVVRAPNGTMPIAGAVLYLTKDKPEPAPETVYCDACVHLSAETPYALSDASGAFDLAATTLGAQYLVVQKGGFRRVREIYVSKGDSELPDTLTTLPPKTDRAAGDEIPRMTVVHGQYDEIEASLEKLGIDPSAIEVVQSALVGVAARSFLANGAAVNGRHIVFLPCGDFTQPPPNLDLSGDAAIEDNLREFVRAGGRLYVTDWHYDFIARTFPGYVTWSGGGNAPCSGCQRASYDAAATVDDPGLAAWMGAQDLATFTVQKNYTSIAAVHSVETTGSSGEPKTVTPRVWVSSAQQGAQRPATVSFEQGCGRVLFSTYHTEPFSNDLTPQERALLGVLLEASVCNDSPTGVVVK
ncbi:MAG: hypothetical protein KF795_25050 [Labilithrix sp.]|nr:hypothetical protein [Labilithrix sp.]